jgi:hypothetical protein
LGARGRFAGSYRIFPFACKANRFLIPVKSLPQLVANYPNEFADGRQVKSTSIGIKDSTDLTLFRGLQNVLSRFSTLGPGTAVNESLDRMPVRSPIWLPAALCVEAVFARRRGTQIPESC